MAKIPKAVPTETIRADFFEPHEHVVVRTYLGNFELQQIQDAALAARGTPGSSDAILQHQLAAAGLAMLKAGVVSWTVTYDDGSPLPCTEDGMKVLPPKYARFIRDELERLWGAWDPEPIRPTTEGDAKRSPSFPVESGGRPGATRPAQTSRSAS